MSNRPYIGNLTVGDYLKETRDLCPNLYELGPGAREGKIPFSGGHCRG